MEIYAVAEVFLRAGTTRLFCSHKQEAEAVLADLAKVFPWRVSQLDGHSVKKYVPEGDYLQWTIDKCDMLDEYAKEWLVRQLLLRGWEPFAATDLSWYFRKKIQE